MDSTDPKQLVLSVHEGALGRFKMLAPAQKGLLGAMPSDVLETLAQALTLMRVMVRVARDQLGSPGAMLVLAGLVWEYIRTTQQSDMGLQFRHLSIDVLKLYRQCVDAELRARGIDRAEFRAADTISQPVKSETGAGAGAVQDGAGMVQVCRSNASDADEDIPIDVELVMAQAEADGLGGALANAQPTQVVKVQDLEKPWVEAQEAEPLTESRDEEKENPV